MSYESFKTFMMLNDLLDDYDRDGALKLYDAFLKGISPKQYCQYILRYKKEQEPEKIIYSMWTFTTDPKCKDLEAQEAYINSILKRKNTLNIRKLYYTKEHWDTNPHFHVVIGSTRTIPSDAFKSYKKFGFVKKSKKESFTDESLQDYLNKENKPITLVE